MGVVYPPQWLLMVIISLFSHSTQCFKRMYGTALRMELTGVVSTDVCNVMGWLDDIHKIYSFVGTS